MGRYAESTTVPADRSRAEIERILHRYGADDFLYGTSRAMAGIRFSMNGRQIKFVLPLPDRDSPEFTRTPGGKRERSEEQAYKAWEQAIRQRWRALALVIKAKLEAVETGVTTFEQEFLAHTVLPDGQTVGEWTEPQIDEAYRTGRMPKLLKAFEPGG